MKKITSLLIALVITLSTNIFSFAAAPKSTTFSSISEVTGLQSFQTVIDNGKTGIFKQHFVQVTEKAVARYYWDNEETKVKLNKENGSEGSMVLSKDKKSITFTFKYDSEGDRDDGYRYTKDTNGNLLVAALTDQTYSNPVIVTKYKSEAELLKQAAAVSKKYEASSDKAHAEYQAKEKLTRSKPVSDTNKLIGSYLSTDGKWKIDIDIHSIEVSYQDSDLTYSYNITKLVNAVGANKLVTSTYTATYYDQKAEKDIPVTIKIVTSTRQKINSIASSNFNKGDAAAIGKVNFKYVAE